MGTLVLRVAGEWILVVQAEETRLEVRADSPEPAEAAAAPREAQPLLDAALAHPAPRFDLDL